MRARLTQRRPAHDSLSAQELHENRCLRLLLRFLLAPAATVSPKNAAMALPATWPKRRRVQRSNRDAFMVDHLRY
jgi:hypothetical protein